MKVLPVEALDGLQPRALVTLGDRSATVVSLDDKHVVIETNHPPVGEGLAIDLQLVTIVT